MRWEVRRWWSGQDVIVIGGGRSLRDFGWHKLAPLLTIGCNDAYGLGTDVCNVCAFGDMKWYLHHANNLKAFSNPVFTNHPSLHEGSPDWLLTLSRKPDGLHKSALGWGGNTGCMAVNLALLLGAARVFLLGFDMRLAIAKDNHWHAENMGNQTVETYKQFTAGFEKVSQQLPSKFPGCEIINIGPNSDLDVFPKAEWSDYF